MTKLGEAAYDERGALAYGQPGDQTGLEVRILDLYNDTNRPWSKVFRAKSEEVRRKLALAMTQACNNNNIGYAQYGDNTTPYKDRYGLNEALKKTASHTIPDVVIPCNVDCSALVAQCCRAAGIDVPITMRTAQEVQILRNTGAFDELDFKLNMKFVPGDILWRNGHTAIITSVSNGPSTEPKWVGKAIGYCDVHTDATVSSSLLKEWPHLGKDNLVDVCDEINGFFYVRISGKYFGYVEKKFIVNASQPEPTPTPTPVPTKKPPFDGETTAKCTLRTGPGANFVSCNVDRNDGLGIRNYLNAGEREKVIAESGEWFQVEIKGSVYTWYPWVEKGYIKEYVNKDPVVGSEIKFTGKNLYTSAYGGKAVAVNNFNGSIVKIYASLKHPYQVKSDNSQYSGYADKKDFEVL